MLAISLPGYTTAELSATRDLTSTIPFVVGDNATYGDYHNVPLTADTVYVLYFVVSVAWDGVVKMAFSQLASPVRTDVEAVTTSGDGEGPTTAVDGPRSAGDRDRRPRSAGLRETSSANDNDRSVTATVVLVVSLGLLVTGTVAAIITVCWRRRRNARYQQRRDVFRQTGSDVIRRNIGESRQTSWMQYSSNHANVSSSLDHVTESVVDDHVTGSAGKPRDLLVVNIASYTAVQFAEEFRQLSSSTDEAPTRTDEATQSHWFVSGYRGRKRSYVVTGAPSDATAAFIYWAVIWQEGITHVVSVGSGSSAGATVYQPEEGQERQFGPISVCTTVVRRLTHATTTTFQIRRTDNDGLPRRLRQYEFTDWPIVDQAVPSTPLHFTEFVEVVRESSRRAQTGASLAPLLVRRPTLDDSGIITVSITDICSYTIMFYAESVAV